MENLEGEFNPVKLNKAVNKVMKYFVKNKYNMDIVGWYKPAAKEGDAAASVAIFHVTSIDVPGWKDIGAELEGLSYRVKMKKAPQMRFRSALLSTGKLIQMQLQYIN